VALVLVVDDEADIRDLVRLNLELEGHDVELAADGVEALAAVADGMRPDLVLLDLMMPRADGWEVLRQLKADVDPDVAATPIVLLTARTGDLDRIRGGIEGALRYLTKPFSVSVLLNAVTDAIEADEAEARLAAQTSALQHLARLERGEAGEPDDVPAPTDGGGRRMRFSRLERRPDGPLPAPAPGSASSAGSGVALDLSRLSPKQLEVLDAVGEHPRAIDAVLGKPVTMVKLRETVARVVAAGLQVRDAQETPALAQLAGAAGH